MQGRNVTCRVVNATITDAFQDMKVSFFTNHSEAQPIYLHTKPEIDGGRRRGWFSDVVNSVVNTVTDAVDTVVDVASFIVTGNGQNSAGTASATFSGSMSIGTNINIDISSYSVQSFSASVDGNMQASLQAAMTAQGAYSDQGSQQLAKFSIATGTIPVFGIPVPVTLFLDLSAGFKFNAHATGTISGSVSASGSVGAGFNYDGSSLAPFANFNSRPHQGSTTQLLKLPRN